jgi:hypothetical protein
LALQPEAQGCKVAVGGGKKLVFTAAFPFVVMLQLGIPAVAVS